jgi:catechol 2,3-dioxygenase-like lactoylglutathione lyase family enzyme
MFGGSRMGAKSLFKSLEHIGIKTVDIEAAVKFYTTILGFDFISRIKPGDVELVFLKLDETVIELVEVNNGTVFSDGVVNHIAFCVNDIFKAVEWLKSNGVELLNEEPRSMGEGRFNFFFRGPSGEKLELYQDA